MDFENWMNGPFLDDLMTKSWNRYMPRELVAKYHERELYGQFRDAYLVDLKKQYVAFQKESYQKKQVWGFTLTTNKVDDEQALKDAVIKLMTQTSCPIAEGQAFLEYTKDGKPHIHGYYTRAKGCRIYAKIFTRSWPLWDESKKHGKGHQGGWHQKINSDQYKDYAAAEGRQIYPVPNV
jgi:hypothetical protein